MASTSRSTERLEVLVNSVPSLPLELLSKIEKFTLTWTVLNGEMYPEVHVTFKQ